MIDRWLLHALMSVISCIFSNMLNLPERLNFISDMVMCMKQNFECGLIQTSIYATGSFLAACAQNLHLL